ncbi:MAG: prepilin peptidase [Clostridia bacterium]|nr:prepilin peptidase [Clostridia bacterium]
MMLALEIFVCAVLLACGYVGVCCYFNNTKLTEINFGLLKLNKKRVAYLTVGAVSVAILLWCLHQLYSIDTLGILNLASLVLVILPAAAVDYKQQKIPNIFLLAGLIIRCVFFVISYVKDFDGAWTITKDSLIGAAVIGLFFLLLLVIFKDSIGMGDVKLFALMGLYQGLWGVINSVFFSLLVSFFLSIGLLITKKKGRKDTISFGPSIYLGTIIAICMAGM